MKFTSVVVTVLIGVILQVALARFTVGGRWVFDLVLVGVVYAALLWGPVAGMLAGTVGGLLQDLLSVGIIGVGGLSKTLVGFGAGVVGTQFVLVRPRSRTLVVAAATVVHRLIILGLYAAIDQRWSGVPWTAILAETAVNALVGFLAFHAADSLPGAVARGRQRGRSSLSRRNW
jgi:rod shape-determining protein MreD